MTLHVTVYTKPVCPQCHATKQALDKLAIVYTTAPIDADILLAARELELGAAPIVAATLPDGLCVQWGGFSPDKIKGLLDPAFVWPEKNIARRPIHH